MDKKASKNMRNVAIVAHGGAGKSTLIESMLLQAKVISKRGTSTRGDKVMMTEPEEADHKLAITPHIAHFLWDEVDVHLVDTPGYFNFLESTRGVLPGVDGVVMVLSAVDGAKPECKRIWRMLKEADVPVVAFVNGVDLDKADFVKAIGQIQRYLDVPALPVSMPVASSSGGNAIVDLLHMKAWQNHEGVSEEIPIPLSMRDDVKQFRLRLVEKIAETSDELLEQYLDGDDLSDQQLKDGLKNAVKNRVFMPMFCGAAKHNIGVEALMDSIVHYLPNPCERALARPARGRDPKAEGAEITRGCDIAEPFSAIVLKTTIDPFSGKLTVVRVFSGEVSNSATVYNATNKQEERIGHVYLVQGKELEKVSTLSAGEIGAFSKLDHTHTGDTLCDPSHPIEFPHVVFADPPVSYAVEADGKTEDKIAEGLGKLVDEDPTLHLYRDEQTHEMIIAGMGQTHIEIALERLARKYGAKAKLRSPRVPYRETIKSVVTVQGKLKKQSGGHGQFANCFLEIGPNERGEGLLFEDHIKGGVIPKQYIPSIEKGVRDAMQQGLLVGYPVIDLVVRVVDGSFHAVDSSDFAFQTAGSLGLKAALEEAGSSLLEPIMHVEVSVPEELTGDVIKDLSSRRGKVLGMSLADGRQEISAEVPMAELLNYGNELSAMSSGRGIYTTSQAYYAEVSGYAFEKVLKEHKAN